MPPRSPVGAVDLVVTSRCNLHCTYCFENARNGRTMPWGTARAALDAVLGSDAPRIDVVFFGGEPTIAFSTIRRAVAYLAARRGRRRVRAHLITNGTLLGPEEVSFLARNRIETQISFDGVREVQDLRGAGTFDRLDALLEAIRARHPAYFRSRVSVALTVTPGTIPHLSRSVSYFLRKRVGEIRIGATMTPGSSWRDSMTASLDRQFALVARLSREHYRRTGRIPVDLLRKPSRRDGVALGRVPMCGAATGARFGVDVDGAILPCGVFARSIQRLPATSLGAKLSALDLGTVSAPARGDGRAEIGIFDDKQEKYSSYGRCGDCRFLRDCAVCPASILLEPGNEDPRRIPDFLCAFNRIWLKHRGRFPTARPSSPEALRRRRRRLLAELAIFAERARGSAPAPRSESTTPSRAGARPRPRG